MALWRKPLQFINVMLANRSSMSVAERGPGRMTYAKKKKPFAEHDLRVTLECAGKKNKTLCRARPARHASARREKRTYVRAGLFVKDQNIKTRKRNAREDLESWKPSAETRSQGTMPSARKLDPKKPRAGKLELIQLSEFGSVAL